MNMLLSLASNPFKVASILLLTLSGYLYTVNLKLERDNVVLKSNTITLESSIKEQYSTINYLKESTKGMNILVSELVMSNGDVNFRLSKSIKEISELRSTEARKSYEKPYERGNFDTDMLSKRLQSITGKADTSTN
tara:strand:- start:900 stop:1307 length:408 start_codon:yes stop_codon:yes gene_type:complete